MRALENNMDAEVGETQQISNDSDNDPANNVDSAAPLEPSVQDFYVAGTSFYRLRSWNTVLICSAIALCASQCIASILLLTKLQSVPEWPGNRLKVLNIWFPGVLGSLGALGVALFCRGTILEVRDLAQRTQKSSQSTSYQKPYIPWTGARDVVAKSKMLWIIIVPALFSFGILIIGGLAFAASIRLVEMVEGIDDPEADHALAIVLLCLHLLIVVCEIFVFLFGIMVPVIVAALTKVIFWKRLACRLYPFAVFVDGSGQGKPLLIEG